MTTVDPSLATVPATFRMSVSEKWTLGFDTSNDLEIGESPSSPVVVMTDLNTGQVITLPDSATLDGNIILQIVRGSSLLAGHTYTLAIGFTVNADTIPLMVLTIIVLPPNGIAAR